MDIRAYEIRFAGHLLEIVRDPRLLRRLMIEFRAIACEIEEEAIVRGREQKASGRILGPSGPERRPHGEQARGGERRP